MSWIPSALKPGWIDEARLIAQEGAFRTLIEGKPVFHGRCLNAGSGDGLYANFLESFPFLTGIVHIDLQQPGFVQQRKDPRHHASKGSLTQLPFSDGEFDCGLCSEVLEHIPDDRKAVQELARVIKPGGFLLVSVPTPPAPFDPMHVREGYTLGVLKDLLERNGFVVLSHKNALYQIMRWTYQLWSWQHRVPGKSRRSFFPAGCLRVLARFDRVGPLGQPWNLAVLAERRQ